jgi:hypothetical protein
MFGRSSEGAETLSRVRLVAAVARRPDLWPTALRQLVVFGGLPSREYLAFRALTQYGDADHRPEAPDVVSYLAWLRSWSRLSCH